MLHGRGPVEITFDGGTDDEQRKVQEHLDRYFYGPHETAGRIEATLQRADNGWRVTRALHHDSGVRIGATPPPILGPTNWKSQVTEALRLAGLLAE